MNSSSKFLKNKINWSRFDELVIEQFEALLVGLVSWMPTVVGMLVRNIVYRGLGMRATGFFWIQPHVTLVNLRRLKVGRNFGCNSGSYINALGGIILGDDVLIGSNVTVSAGKHVIEGRESTVFSRPAQPSPITFENDVWIGAGAVILPGLTIAKGTVVGANSVVTRSTEEYSVVAGAPSRIIRFR